MPTLCVHSGNQRLSFLLAESQKSPIFSQFAYPYCESLFSPSFSFTDYIKTVAGELLDIDVSLCDVFLTGALNHPENLPTALLGVTTYNTVYADDFILAHSGAGVSLAVPPNLAIYPFGTHTANFEEMPQIPSPQFSKSKPFAFCGKRFEAKNESATYLRMLNVMRGSGVFEVYLDANDKLPVLGLLGLHDSGGYVDTIDSVDLEKVGLVISADGPVECLIETPDGTQQLVEVESNDLFILPLAPKVESRVVVKNRWLGCVERLTSGGLLGLAIDTREKVANRKSWESIITAGLRGL